MSRNIDLSFISMTAFRFGPDVVLSFRIACACHVQIHQQSSIERRFRAIEIVRAKASHDENDYALFVLRDCGEQLALRQAWDYFGLCLSSFPLIFDSCHFHSNSDGVVSSSCTLHQMLFIFVFIRRTCHRFIKLSLSAQPRLSRLSHCNLIPSEFISSITSLLVPFARFRR